MGARHCDTCDTRWPTTGYAVCPACQVETRFQAAMKPLPEDDARNRVLHLNFESEYDKRERGVKSKCGTQPSGPSPEALGAIAARDPHDRDRQILELERTYLRERA